MAVHRQDELPGLIPTRSHLVPCDPARFGVLSRRTQQPLLRPHVLRQHHRLARQWMPRRFYQPFLAPCRQQGRRVAGQHVRRCLRWCQCRRLLFFGRRSLKALAFSVGHRRRLWIRIWHMVLLPVLWGYGTQETQIPLVLRYERPPSAGNRGPCLPGPRRGVAAKVRRWHQGKRKSQRSPTTAVDCQVMRVEC